MKIAPVLYENSSDACCYTVSNNLRGQLNRTVEKRKYRNDKTKLTVLRRGIDTIELKSYSRNGQLKDSVELYLGRKKMKCHWVQA